MYDTCQSGEDMACFYAESFADLCMTEFNVFIGRWRTAEICRK